jgi:hypothetical protein
MSENIVFGAARRRDMMNNDSRDRMTLSANIFKEVEHYDGRNRK